MSILPIDSGRYGSYEMRHVFDEENRLQKWLDVEAAVAKAQASVGDIPVMAAEEIARNANLKTVTVARTRQIEETIRHDLMSMVVALTESCSGEGRKYVHYGLTSSDVEDTALALQLKAAFTILFEDLNQLQVTLSRRIRKHRRLLVVARTHGQHAGVVTLGLKFAVWLAEVRRHEQRLRQVRERTVVGKILGIVGTGAGLGKNALRVQQRALSRLGLKPAGLVTQVIQRDLHAEVVFCLALLGSSLDKFATEFRNLQRTEIAEAMEAFERTRQVGSSALPSKRNPILCERVSSFAKLLRGLVVPAMENVSLWHERDLSNSANERFLFPMSFIILDEMVRLIRDVLDGLEVDPQNMARNLGLSQGRFLSERVVNLLVTKGVPRQEAYARVRKIATLSSDRRIPFHDALLKDSFMSSQLKPVEIEKSLDYATYLGSTNRLIDMALAS